MFSRTSLDNLLNKINITSVSKDVKTEAPYGLQLELQQQNEHCSLDDLISSEAWHKLLRA